MSDKTFNRQEPQRGRFGGKWPVVVCLEMACLALVLFGCATFPSRLQRFSFSRPEMGTVFTITLCARDPAAAKAAAEAAFQRVSRLNDVMSDENADSEVTRLCDQPYAQPVRVSQDLFDALQLSLRMSQLSEGEFDVTVGPYVQMWRMAQKEKVLPTPAQITAARPSVGWQKVRLDPKNRTVTLLAPNMKLDLGGICRGIAADQAMLVLHHRGIYSAMVTANGETAVGSPPPAERGWTVGISVMDGPANSGGRQVVLHNAGISTDGDSEQFVEIGGVRYSSIVDPATGLGLTNRIEGTVIGPNAAMTASLETAVKLLGVKRGLALVDSLSHSAAIISTEENGKVQTYPSRRFKHVTQLPAP